MTKTKQYYWLLLLCVFFACRKGADSIVPLTVTPVATGDTGSIKGFFLLNEANMGSNKLACNPSTAPTVASIKLSVNN